MPDVRVALRHLIRQPALNALAILAFGLGIGLTATMFSIVYGVVLRGLPFDRPEQLIHIARNQLAAGIPRMPVTIHDFADWRAQQHAFEDLAGYANRTVAFATSAEPAVRLQAAEVTPNTFRLLRVQPVLGRTFLDTEQGASAPDVVILGYGIWRDRFNRDPQIIGRVVRVNVRPTVVIGVMPEGFGFPFRQDAWLPLRVDPVRVARGRGDTFEAVGRLRDGVSIPRAATELREIAAGLGIAHPATNAGIGVVVQPFIQRYVGESGILGLYTMLGAVFAVLLIACVNVANLSLARATMRSRQIAIHVSLGATRARVAMGVLVETLVLVALGSGVGVGLATLGIDAFNKLVPAHNLPFWIAVTLDLPVLMFVLALVVAATVCAGIVPALRAARVDVNDALKDGSHGATGGRVSRASRALVVLEVALSSMLLVGAALMIRGVLTLQQTEWGFPADHIITARAELPETADALRQGRFTDELLRALRAQHGVLEAALATALPVLGTPRTRVVVEGEATSAPHDGPMVHSAAITPGFFETFSVPLIEGRLIAETDRNDTLRVAVINQSFAQRHFQGRTTLGHRFRAATATDDAWLTIVGVVADAHMDDVSHPSHIEAGYYVPLAQVPARAVNLAVRADGTPSAFAATLGRIVFTTDPDAVVSTSQTMQAAIGDSTWFYGLFGGLFGVFGVTALALGMIGLYGVLMFSVKQRTREIGVRMALGADAADVLRLVMSQGLWQFGLGLAIGLVLAMGLAKTLVAFIYGMQRNDPITFVLVSLVLAITALVACLVPAHQAARIDPTRALRAE